MKNGMVKIAAMAVVLGLAGTTSAKGVSLGNFGGSSAGFSQQVNGGGNFFDWLEDLFGGHHQGGGKDKPRTKVPEPATLALLGTGLLAMGLARRRKKSK